MQRLEGSLHEAPIIDKDSYSYLIHPISNSVPMLDPQLLHEVVVGITRATDLDVDKIVAPEAMGIHIVIALSLQTDVPLVIIHKREYGLDDEVALHQTTGYFESEMFINDIEDRDRVLIVDDLLLIGGTLVAICGALNDVGTEVSDIVVAIRKVGETALDNTDYEATNLVGISVDGDGVEIH